VRYWPIAAGLRCATGPPIDRSHVGAILCSSWPHPHLAPGDGNPPGAGFVIVIVGFRLTRLRVWPSTIGLAEGLEHVAEDYDRIAQLVERQREREKK